MTNPIDSDGTCPGCGAAHGVQPQPAPPKVAAWTCPACGLDWAVTVVPFLDRLTATVAMRQVIALADDAATLTDEQLRDRLLALAGRARSSRNVARANIRELLGHSWPKINFDPPHRESP